MNGLRTEEDGKPWTGEFSILNHTGHTKLIWDSKNRDEVDNARRTFDEMRKKGFLAAAVKKDGTAGAQVHEFDPEAEKIILSPAMAGG